VSAPWGREFPNSPYHPGEVLYSGVADLLGDALQAHIDDQPRADYGERIIPDLSKDLHLS